MDHNLKLSAPIPNFPGLPLELKALIISHFSQSLSFTTNPSRPSYLNPPSSFSGTGGPNDLLKDLISLSQVSREFYLLSRPNIYETLDTRLLFESVSAAWRAAASTDGVWDDDKHDEKSKSGNDQKNEHEAACSENLSDDDNDAISLTYEDNNDNDTAAAHQLSESFPRFHSFLIHTLPRVSHLVKTLIIDFSLGFGFGGGFEIPRSRRSCNSAGNASKGEAGCLREGYGRMFEMMEMKNDRAGGSDRDEDEISEDSFLPPSSSPPFDPKNNNTGRLHHLSLIFHCSTPPFLTPSFSSYSQAAVTNRIMLDFFQPLIERVPYYLTELDIDGVGEMALKVLEAFINQVSDRSCGSLLPSPSLPSTNNNSSQLELQPNRANTDATTPSQLKTLNLSVSRIGNVDLASLIARMENLERGSFCYFFPAVQNVVLPPVHRPPPHPPTTTPSSLLPSMYFPKVLPNLSHLNLSSIYQYPISELRRLISLLSPSLIHFSISDCRLHLSSSSLPTSSSSSVTGGSKTGFPNRGFLDKLKVLIVRRCRDYGARPRNTAATGTGTGAMIAGGGIGGNSSSLSSFGNSNHTTRHVSSSSSSSQQMEEEKEDDEDERGDLLDVFKHAKNLEILTIGRNNGEVFGLERIGKWLKRCGDVTTTTTIDDLAGGETGAGAWPSLKQVNIEWNEDTRDHHHSQTLPTSSLSSRGRSDFNTPPNPNRNEGGEDDVEHVGDEERKRKIENDAEAREGEDEGKLSSFWSIKESRDFREAMEERAGKVKVDVCVE